MSVLKTISIVVKGKVQGVWYRASAKAVADDLRLTGFVANSSDGSVYIEATGTPEALNAFVRWCQEGPELARVEHTVISDLPDKTFPSFEIKRGAF